MNGPNAMRFKILPNGATSPTYYAHENKPGGRLLRDKRGYGIKMTLPQMLMKDLDALINGNGNKLQKLEGK